MERNRTQHYGVEVEGKKEMSWVVTVGSGAMQDVNGICNLSGDRQVRRKSALLQVLLNTENYLPQNERTLLKKKGNRYSRAIKQNIAPGAETGAKEMKAIRQYQYMVLIWQRDCTATHYEAYDHFQLILML